MDKNCVPAFLWKLWKIVDDVSTNEVIAWRETGDSFIIWQPIQFATEILPKYYLHKNIASFVRQLNMYGFYKVVEDSPRPDTMSYAHRFFLRENEESLNLIKRKTPGVQWTSQTSHFEKRVGYYQTPRRRRKHREIAPKLQVGQFIPQIISQSTVTSTMIKNMNPMYQIEDDGHIAMAISENPDVDESNFIAMSMDQQVTADYAESESSEYDEGSLLSQNGNTIGFYPEINSCNVPRMGEHSSEDSVEIGECFICLYKAKNNITLSTAELRKVFNNFGTYLDQSLIDESLQSKKLISLCKFCFFSSSQFNKFKENLEKLEKDMKDLSAMYSGCVSDRRNQFYKEKKVFDKKSDRATNRIDVVSNSRSVKNRLRHSSQNFTNIGESSTDIFKTTAMENYPILNTLLDYNVQPENRDIRTTESVDMLIQKSSDYNSEYSESCVDVVDIKHELIEPQHANNEMLNPLKETTKEDLFLDLYCGVDDCDTFSNQENDIEPVHVIEEDSHEAMENEVESNISNKSSQNVVPLSELMKSVRLPFIHLKRITFDSSPKKDTSQVHQHESEESHHLTPSPNIHQCLICKKSFIMRNNLKKHLESHTRGTSLKCSFCDEIFPSTSQLILHEKLHTNVPPYKCSFCRITFTTVGQLEVHERIHTGKIEKL